MAQHGNLCAGWQNGKHIRQPDYPLQRGNWYAFMYTYTATLLSHTFWSHSTVAVQLGWFVGWTAASPTNNTAALSKQNILCLWAEFRAAQCPLFYFFGLFRVWKTTAFHIYIWAFFLSSTCLCRNHQAMKFFNIGCAVWNQRTMGLNIYFRWVSCSMNLSLAHNPDRNSYIVAELKLQKKITKR